MNENKIIELLEYIRQNGSGACDKCAVFPCGKIKDYEDNQCGRFIAENVLDLISRQKAEIERLKSAKSEAIKEFADRLKEKDGYYNHIFDDCANTEFYSSNYVKGRQEKSREIRETIDNLVKEMGGND